MTTPRIRITAAVLDVLSVLAAASEDSPEWGLSICQRTGYGTGTVYPVLERLLKAGWITDRWEEPTPADRPRRRYFEMSGTGRQAYGAEVAKRRQRGLDWGGTLGGAR